MTVEMRNEVMQEVAEAQEDAYKSGAVQYIDSREVAEMVGKRHPDLKRDIKRYIAQLDMSKIAHIDFLLTVHIVILKIESNLAILSQEKAVSLSLIN